MATINEFLKENLNEEQLAAIAGVELKGEVFTEPMVPVRRINEVTTEKKNLEEQLTTQTAALEELKGSADLSDTLKANISDMDAERKTIEKTFAEQLETSNLNHKIDLAIQGTEPKNFTAVSSLFNRDEIKLDGDELLGFKGQYEKIKETEPYLFKDDKSKKLDTDNGTGTKAPAVNPWKVETRNLSQQVTLRRDNPSLAAKLEKEAKVETY